jgi:hypothetical protein
MKERTKLLLSVVIFLACYYVPWDHATIRQSGLEAFMMLQEYAREHVLTCLIPAFFIAGAIAVFVSQAAVLKYFGATTRKILSYSVASVCRDLYPRRRYWSGYSFSLFRTGHQCPGHRADSKDSGMAAWVGQSYLRSPFCSDHRAAYGYHIPE